MGRLAVFSPAAMAGAPGQRRHGLRRPAVVAQRRAQLRLDAEQVARGGAEARAVRGIADQVVVGGSHRAEDVRAGVGGVVGHDGVRQGHRLSRDGVEAAAEQVVPAVGTDGVVEERGKAGVVAAFRQTPAVPRAPGSRCSR